MEKMYLNHLCFAGNMRTILDNNLRRKFRGVGVVGL
jgi:hypothetical protein